MSSDDADRYRKQAEECRQQAQKAVSPLDKEAWLRVAEEWLMLAQSTEESRRRRSGDSLRHYRSDSLAGFLESEKAMRRIGRSRISMIDLANRLGSPRAFGVIAGHLPSAILILPKPVSRSPPETSSIYPSSISRALCSAGMRCIKPLAPSRNETNSSRVNVGADKTWAIRRICAYGWPVQASHPATIKLTHYHLEARRGAVVRGQPPGISSSSGFAVSVGNPLAIWRTIRNDLLHDITAGAAGSISQQILHRGADLRLGVVRARKLPIVLI
jgi:hypothetical protein